MPTLIEYGVGSGRVLALAQTLEYAWMEGQDGALILENSVPYAIAFEPFTDITWLSVDPVAGLVAPDGTATLVATIDATGLEPGSYLAEIVVRTNDPLNRIMRIAVTMSVG